MGLNFSSALEKSVEMFSGSIVFTKRWTLWGVGTAAVDSVYIAIKKSIGCW